MHRIKAAIAGINLKPLLALLILWDILALAEILIHSYMDRGLFKVFTLPFSIRWRILMAGLMISFLVLVGLGSVLLYAFRLARSKRLTQVVDTSLLWVLGLFYISSWVLFVTNKTFLDHNTLGIIWNDPWQMFQHLVHMVPVIAVAFPVALFAISGSLVFGANRWAHRLTAQSVQFLVLGHIILVAAMPIYISFIDYKFRNAQYIDRRSLAVRDSKEIYSMLLHLRTDPIATLAIDLYRNSPISDGDTHADRFVLPHHTSPLVSLKQYVAGVEESKTSKKNVILLLVESLRPDMLTAYGSPEPYLPNFEALSEKSIVFTDIYSQASHSSYADVCPLSSHYPLRTRGVHFYPPNPPYPRVLIYDVLKQLGYRTAIFSSQNENWGSMYNYLQSPNLDRFFHSKTFDGPTYIPHGDHGFAAYATRTKSGKIDDRYTVAEAIKWIDEEREQPFFIYMNLQNSHIPFQIPEDFERKYSPRELDFKITFGHFPKDRIDDVKGVYADSLRYIDYQFNKIVEHLRVAGRLEDTIIIVSADTGQAFYEHNYASHASYIYDEVMRVPLFIYVGGEISQTMQRPGQHIDVPPTLFGLLGLPSHPSFQGVDLLASDKPIKPRSRFILAQALKTQYGIIRDNFKLIYSPRRRSYELYGLANDPGEYENLIGRHPSIEKDLKNRLHSWIALQLDYYGDMSRNYETYPPFYTD